MPNPKPLIPYPSRRNDERRREKANDQIEKFYKIFKDLSFEISLTDALILMPKFASTLKALIGNKEKLSKMARTPLNEHCSAVILNKLPEKLRDPGKFLIPCDFPGIDECLALANLCASINLMPLSVWKKISLPKLTPTYFDADPRLEKIAVTINLENKLPEYSSNYEDMMANRIDVNWKWLLREYTQEVLTISSDFPVINGQKNFSVEEKAALIKVLKSHKRAIAWKLSDIKGINPEFYTHKILMEEDYKLAVQHQRRMNPKIYDVIKKEVEKLLDARLISPISDSPWTGIYPLSLCAMQQRHEKHFRPIHYASKTMNEAESHYTTTEKEMLAVVYAFEKFRSYLILNKSIMYTDHSALKYLFAKKDSKARLLRWVLLLQEFKFKVTDTKGAENLAADHLSRLENPYENVLDPKEINKKFPLETLNMVTFRGDSSTPWFVDYANYHARNFIVKGMSSQQKNKFFKDVKHYF
ncbi:reverse transcriptase domain-containing protein [Tanacetum coccineum]